MPKLNKRLVDSLRPDSDGERFIWDDELRGFGLRLKRTGVKTYFVQYRNAEGLTRRLVIGKHGVLAPEQARKIAIQKLAAVSAGADPSAERHAVRAAITVGEACDWYLDEAGAGRLLGRSRRPIKPSSLKSDRGRIEHHIKPLLGSRAVRSLTLADIERMQSQIAAGKTAKTRSGRRGGCLKGGEGAAARTVATLRAVFGHARRLRMIDENPAIGVRQLASQKRTRRLSEEEIVALGEGLRVCARAGESPVALAALELMLLTGFRRMEVLGLKAQWVGKSAINFPDTKSGPQTRGIGKEAVLLIKAQFACPDQIWVFPSDRCEGHLVCVEKTLRRACSVARLEGVTPHTLRHTFASIAGDLGYSELTIAGLLGHAAMGVTQRYIHLDKALVVAADETSERMVGLLRGSRRQRKLAA